MTSPSFPPSTATPASPRPSRRAALAGLALLTATLTAASLPGAAQAERIRHRGYSVERPAGESWRLIQNTAEILAFRRQQPRSPTTVIAFGRLLPETAADYPALEAVAARITGSTERSAAARRVLAGAKCVFKRFRRPSKTSRDRQYTLSGADLFCQHPRTNAVIHLGFSQRYPEDEAPVGTGGEMLSFFNSLRFH